MSVYVHIGTMKTGTTTLQCFLYRNRARLLRHGYLYPLSIKARSEEFHSHNPLAAGHPAAFMEALLCEVRAAGVPHLIISAENLQRELTTPQQLRELRACLERLHCGDIRIIVYLRAVRGLVTSLCTQTLKAGDAGDYARLPPQESHPWFRIVPDHRATLQRWGEVFGTGQLSVRRYERERLLGGDLLQDFMQTIGCPWEEGLEIPADCNQALNLLEMELLRRINALTPGSVHAAHTIKHQLYELMHRHLSGADPQLRFELPPAVMAAYEEYFRDSEDWVRRHFFPEEGQAAGRDGPPGGEERSGQAPGGTPGGGHCELRQLRACDWDRLAALLLAAAGSQPPAADGGGGDNGGDGGGGGGDRGSGGGDVTGEAEPGALSFHYRHPLLSLLLRLGLGARRRRQFMLAPQACLTSGPPLLRLALRLAQRQD